MSQHRSLKGSGKITAKRGQWKEGDRGQGLRKTMPEA